MPKSIIKRSNIVKTAIYVRKSVEVKDSISIETQIQMCQNYFIDTECEFEIFSDDGYSGANINRPAFKRLLKKIELKCFDTLVCYKLDRISRKVLDIADIFDLLEKSNVKFICVKDNYDTSTPMGRAMLYFASVFAQLEREQTAERVTDSMLNLAKRGCWTGGPAPTGYKIIKSEGKSYIELENADFIKDCFNLYMQYSSLYSVHKILQEKYKITPKERSNIRRILRSPVYVQSSDIVSDFLKKHNWGVVGEPNSKGYLTYGVTKGDSMAIVSRHTAVIEPVLWLNVQKKLDERRESYFKKDSKVYWLSGILKCPCGAPYAIVNSNRNAYYVCSNRLKKKCDNNRYVNAEYIEKEVENYIISNSMNFNTVYQKEESPSAADEIKKQIEDNNRMINNLVNKIALLSNEASKALLIKIEELTQENKELTNKLEDTKLAEFEINNSKFSKEFVYSNVMKFNKDMSAEEKKIIVRNIFKSLEYDAKKDTLKVEFL